MNALEAALNTNIFPSLQNLIIIDNIREELVVSVRILDVERNSDKIYFIDKITTEIEFNVGDFFW